MSNKFERENRYLVLKHDDVKQYLSPEQQQQLEVIIGDICDAKGEIGKPLQRYVCVAEDWPMYEDTWRAIKRWVVLDQIAQEHPELIEAAQRFNELLQQYMEELK